jgi:ATP-dependent DNA helicase Rep
MGNILKLANHLIANNAHVFEKTLWSQLGYGEPIRVITADNEEDEAEKVVNQLCQHKFMHRKSYRDYAILYRGNHQSRVFEQMLRERDVPYQLSGGPSFFENAEVRDILAYLRVLVNPDDDNAFLRIVNTPRRELGPATVGALAEYAAMRGKSLFEASSELGLAQRLGERPLRRLQEFTGWLARIAEMAEREPPGPVARALVQDMDYQGHLELTQRDNRAAERRMKNVHELIAWIERIAEREEGEIKFASLVAHLSLLDIMERRSEEETGDRVQLMTLHAAKGLEFPHVFLVGVEEEILPHRTSIAEENIEEERRLAYVGITRAQRTLTFSLAGKRKRGGETVVCEPSRFLLELPQEDLQWQGRAETAPEVRQEQGKRHLADLRKFLKER